MKRRIAACLGTGLAASISNAHEAAEPDHAPDQPASPTPAATFPASDETPRAQAAWSFGDSTGLNEFLTPEKLSFWGYADFGMTLNPASPRDRQNFGRLFDDRSNEVVLNQLTMTLDRAMDTGDTFDWGGRIQFMYGSDARFIHYPGFMDNVTDNQVQPTFSELFLTAHLPVLTAGGIDLKLGQFVTLMGAETIDPRPNYFYSHTYSFNFGIPFNHTGALATVHLPSNFNLMLGGVTGMNTGFEDNNDRPSFHGGVSWATSDNVLGIASALHIGPENPESVTTFDANDKLRYINDTVITWNPSEKWQLIGDFVYGRDTGFQAEWYGAALYARYKVSDTLALVGRAEVFRDDDGFAVVQFGNNDDPVHALRGQSIVDPRTVGGGATTYCALTAGLGYAPCPNVMIRPEVRWDIADTQSGTTDGPFDDSQHREQFTFGIDFILKF